MNRRVSTFFLALLLLFPLSGCGAMQAWERIRERDESIPAADSSPAASLPASSEPAHSVPADPAPLPSREPSSLPEQGDPDDTALKQLQDEICRSTSAAGLAFLGYVDSSSSEMDLRDYLLYSDVGAEYPFLPMAPLVMTEGQELYAVVPPNEYGTVTIYASGITEWGEYADDTGVPLGEGLPGEPVIVLCNLSEIYSNVLISVTDGGGAVSFRPALSMEDGRLAQTPGVYDFSIYEQEPDEAAVPLAEERLMQIGEVREAMQQGMQLTYTGNTQYIAGETCLLFALGTGSGDQFVLEFYYAYAVSDGSVYAYDGVYDLWFELDA